MGLNLVQSVFSINSTLVQSSSNETEGNEFAVNELFQISIESLIPPGTANVSFVVGKLCLYSVATYFIKTSCFYRDISFRHLFRLPASI